MSFLFFLKCFFIGIAAASAVGPIFVLTFNSGATHGFTRGFFTALGAALGDGFLLFLGLLGALSILGSQKQYHMLVSLLGGGLLIAFGISMMLTRPSIQDGKVISIDSIVATISKIFFSTILNPLTIFFFIFISSQILSSEIKKISYSSIFLASCATTCGSLLVLSLVSYSASKLGSVISFKNLQYLSLLTGAIIVSVGIYFCIDAFQILNSFKS